MVWKLVQHDHQCQSSVWRGSPVVEPACPGFGQ
jgi:hypothetical protein